ncbi:hypothetical protein [Paenibacillus tuaregi]|uniref:hypothetical protein n=1 Tax=Paenibacillus tuaregi TaxID=1816681 RepID=UPI00083813B4|nr:hypothetical protein [Paenibacillus tuaregi]
MKHVNHKYLRNKTHKVSDLSAAERRCPSDTFLLYNGSFEDYEDPADYLPYGHSAKAVRIA